MFLRRIHAKKGVTAVEVVIGVSIAALVLVFASQAILQFINTGRNVTEKTQALYLAEEGLELLRFIRDDSWATISGLSINTPHYIAVGASAVGVTSTPEVIEGFTRSFVVSNVYRNASTDDIVASTTGGAVSDTDAKYVMATVTWGNPTTTVSLTSIIANLDP